MPKTHPFSTQIAGAYYRDSAAQATLAEADRDTPIRLVPEPDNPYDSNAIAVYVEGPVLAYHVGYIPRNHCENVLVMLPTLTSMYIENSTLHLVYTDPTSV